MTGKEYRQELAKFRETQITLFKALQAKCAAALTNLQAADASWSDVNSTLRLLNNTINQAGAQRTVAQTSRSSTDALAGLRIVGSRETKRA